MPKESGDQKPQEDQDEEREACDQGYVWEVWDEGVQNRVKHEPVIKTLRLMIKEKL